ESASRAYAGQFRLIGADWPPSEEKRWWDTDLWLLDPVSGKHWPGAARPASQVNYRHQAEFGDVKFVWELNRLSFLAAIALSERDGEGSALSEIVAGWMRVNPPYDGVNWTSGIE